METMMSFENRMLLETAARDATTGKYTPPEGNMFDSQLTEGYRFSGGVWDKSPYRLPEYYRDSEDFGLWSKLAGFPTLFGVIDKGSAAIAYLYTGKHGWLARVMFEGAKTIFVVIPTFPDLLTFKKEMNWLFQRRKFNRFTSF